MKNTLGDLSLHLFEELERLNDDSLTEDQLEKEVNRAHAMADVSGQIIRAGNLMLRAKAELGTSEMPKMLGDGS